MKVLVALALSSACVLATSASAQTAEETVMYILHGYEGEINATDPNLYMVPDDNDENAFYFKMPRSPGTDLDGATTVARFKYTRIDDCNYEANVMLPVDMNARRSELRDLEEKANVEIDFSKVINMDTPYRNAHFSSEFQGIRYNCNPVGDQKKCSEVMDMFHFPFLNFGEIDRVQNAYAYFRQHYCHGSAF